MKRTLAAKELLEHKYQGEDAEEYRGTTFGGFEDYIADKIRKLRNQAVADTDIVSEIFRGCIIYVTGYTNPPLNELKKLITTNGGIHSQFFEGKRTITHVISNGLSNSKRQEFAKFKVVRPEWITESIKAGRLLPWSNFATYRTKTTLFDQFTKPRTDQNDELAPITKRESIDEGTEFVADSQSTVNTEAVQGFASESEEGLRTTEAHGQIATKTAASDPLQDKESAETLPVAVAPHYSPQTGLPHENKTFDVSDSEPEHLPGHEESHGTGEVEKQLDTEPFVHFESPQRVPNSDGKRIINCLDPNFIKSYYENSRLHHLSTWKADLKRQFQHIALAQNRQNHRHGTKKSTERVILHVDYDSFFVSVALKSRPHLQGKPACVSNGGSKSADVASCNYEARKFGVRNGMWVADALEKCPDLICLAYDFKGYEEASSALYDSIVDLHPDYIFPVSVDEALLDITSLVLNLVEIAGKDREDQPNKPPRRRTDKDEKRQRIMDLANDLRSSIENKSGISASVGVGPNVLLAKLALRKAKPSGAYYLPEEEALSFTQDLPVRELPGVGWSMASRLKEVLNVNTIGELRACNKGEIKKLLGHKLGAKLIDSSYGVDSTDISIIDKPASLGVEIAWAVRVKTDQEALQFISNLSEELFTHLKKLQSQTPTWPVSGRHLTIKIYRRAPNAPIDPPKYMGCGECIISSKARLLDRPVAHVRDIYYALQNMYPQFGCPPADLRGVGISLKLSGSSDTSDDATKNDKITGHFQKTTRDELFKVQHTEMAALAAAAVADDRSPSNRSPSNGRGVASTSAPSTPTKRNTRTSSLTAINKKISPKKTRVAPVRSSKNQGQIVTMFQSKLEEEVLNELPTQLRQELLEERELILGPKRKRLKTSEFEQPRIDEPQYRMSLPYLPVKFAGKTSSSEIRSIIKEWVLSTLGQGGPNYEDICVFEKFIISSAKQDRDWGKIVRLLCWMKVFIQHQEDEDWKFLSEMFGKVAMQHLTERGINVNIS